MTKEERRASELIEHAKRSRENCADAVTVTSFNCYVAAHLKRRATSFAAEAHGVTYAGPDWAVELLYKV